VNTLFTGKGRHSEFNLDMFGARHYGSSLGRFITPNWWPSRPTTVPYAKFADPQTLNLYAYVENAPLNRADADGHCTDHHADGSCKVNCAAPDVPPITGGGSHSAASDTTSHETDA
jgi:RHS repeat-associated protein